MPLVAFAVWIRKFRLCAPSAALATARLNLAAPVGKTFGKPDPAIADIQPGLATRVLASQQRSTDRTKGDGNLNGALPNGAGLRQSLRCMSSLVRFLCNRS